MESPDAKIGPKLFVEPSVFQICPEASPDFCFGDRAVDVSEEPDASTVELVSANPEYALHMTKLRVKPYLEATWFTYDNDRHQIKSWGRRSLCATKSFPPVQIFDGIRMLTSSSGMWVLQACDNTSADQRFVHNEVTKLLALYHARKMCLDDSDAWGTESKTVSAEACRLDKDAFQRVELVEVESVDASDPGTVTVKCPKLRLHRDRRY